MFSTVDIISEHKTLFFSFSFFPLLSENLIDHPLKLRSVNISSARIDKTEDQSPKASSIEGKTCSEASKTI